MKKLLICLFMLAVAVSGCSNQRMPDENPSQAGPAVENFDFRFQYDQPLTVDDVKLAFEHHGLNLIEGKDEPPQYLIDKVSPSIYSVNDSKQVIYVYLFDSTAGRKQAVGEGGDPLNLPTVFWPQPDGHMIRAYTSRNILIVDMLDLSMISNIPSKEEQVLKTIPNIMSALNNSQRTVFIAKSQNWDAQYLVEYYQHWYKDAAGVTHADQYSTGKWSVKYIGPNPESIQGIKYTYRTPAHGGSGDGIFAKEGEYYYLVLPEDKSNSIPTNNSVYTLTITSPGQEETLDLKPIFY